MRKTVILQSGRGKLGIFVAKATVEGHTVTVCNSRPDARGHGKRTVKCTTWLG